MTRIRGLFNLSIGLGHTEKSFECWKDVLLRERAINVVSRNLKILLKERRHNNVQEMNVLAEQFIEVMGICTTSLALVMNQSRIRVVICKQIITVRA